MLLVEGIIWEQLFTGLVGCHYFLLVEGPAESRCLNLWDISSTPCDLCVDVPVHSRLLIEGVLEAAWHPAALELEAL